MATISLVRPALPVLTKNQGIVFETAAVANGDDLVLTAVEAPAHRTILCTPAVAATDLASISNGVFAGQRLTLLVANANTLGVPIALGNVDSTADLDGTKDTPIHLVWNGAAWQAA